MAFVAARRIDGGLESRQTRPRRAQSPRAVLIVILACLVTTAHPGAFAQSVSSNLASGFIETWSGDFDGMVERHRIRLLVAYGKTFYFLDGADQRGISYELGKAFEKSVNEQLKKRTVRVEVVFIPVPRDQLLTELVAGRGDIAASNLTITSERRKLVDFSRPLLSGVSEIVVTGPAAPELHGVDDLSGRTIHVRESSSYHESLTALNERFKQAGKAQMQLVPADENLEDEDLLEMVNAGLLPMIVVDSHKAQFWAQIFDDIELHPDISVRSAGQIAWAFRKDSPKLEKVINAFVEKNKKGTLLGNILLKRYLKSTKYVKNALSEEELKKFTSTVDFLRQYAGQYGFDWLVIAALAYQESRLDQSVRSAVGAVGVMQILPSTAADPNVGIKDIHDIGPNIHAGVKYLHFLRHRYFQDPAVDERNQWLFTFAAYNAGPAKVAQLREEAPKMGLDPNVWFRNVELVAAKRIGRETVQYVSNIFKYYIAYTLIAQQRKLKDSAQKTVPQ